MHFLDLTLPTIGENLALDEALLLQAEAGGGEALRSWEWEQTCVVLGAGGHLVREVNEATCHADGIPIARRASGGGTVVLARGCLCFALVLSYESHAALRQICSSYCFILERLKGALTGLGTAIEPAGTSDLAAGGHKLSGSAQQRKRSYLLHHGTLLYDFDTSPLGRYLRMPARQPEYRHQREHSDFLMNLPTRRDDLIERLRWAWGANIELTAWPQERVRQLVEEKYSRPEWIRRR